MVLAKEPPQKSQGVCEEKQKEEEILNILVFGFLGGGAIEDQETQAEFWKVDFSPGGKQTQIFFG